LDQNRNKEMEQEAAFKADCLQLVWKSSSAFGDNQIG
jgi:hypothetical protein